MRLENEPTVKEGTFQLKACRAKHSSPCIHRTRTYTSNYERSLSRTYFSLRCTHKTRNVGLKTQKQTTTKQTDRQTDRQTDARTHARTHTHTHTPKHPAINVCDFGNTRLPYSKVNDVKDTHSSCLIMSDATSRARRTRRGEAGHRHGSSEQPLSHKHTIRPYAGGCPEHRMAR